MSTFYWNARAEAESIAAEPRWILHRQKHMGVGDAEGYLRGRWGARNWLNVPGPFYGAETDTCLAGIRAAPRNVACDDYGMEFIWRQPVDLDEVRSVLDAAYQDPFNGYNWDGDDHWTPDLVLDWWEGRARIDEWLAGATFSDFNSEVTEISDRASQYRRYIAGGLRDDLLRYAEWLSVRQP